MSYHSWIFLVKKKKLKVALPSYAHLLKPLPPKTIFGSQQSIAEKRIVPLETYLQDLLTQPVPVFRNNLLFQRFLENVPTDPTTQVATRFASSSFPKLTRAPSSPSSFSSFAPVLTSTPGASPDARQFDLTKNGAEWASFIRQVETALTALKAKLAGNIVLFPTLL